MAHNGISSFSRKRCAVSQGTGTVIMPAPGLRSRPTVAVKPGGDPRIYAPPGHGPCYRRVDGRNKFTTVRFRIFARHKGQPGDSVPLTLPLRGSLPLPARGERAGVRGHCCPRPSNRMTFCGVMAQFRNQFPGTGQPRHKAGHNDPWVGSGHRSHNCIFGCAGQLCAFMGMTRSTYSAGRQARQLACGVAHQSPSVSSSRRRNSRTRSMTSFFG
jgi:hypothetical protein